MPRVLVVKKTYDPGCRGSAAEAEAASPSPHRFPHKRRLAPRPQNLVSTSMALSSPTAPGFLAAVPRSSSGWRASIETPQQSSSVGRSLRFPPRLGPLFWPWEKVKVGPLSVSPMGFGTWAWGNQLLWGYQEQMDGVLQETFNLALRNGITLFDTADSYGTGRLNGKSEKLLGKFIREFQGSGNIQDNIVIATKFAAYPWRLTSGQFVRACKYSL